MAKLSEMSDDEASAALLKAYRGACDGYDGENDEHGRHPSQDVNRWLRIAATGGTNSEKHIQSQDDVQPSESEPGNAGAQPGMDGRYTVDSDGSPVFETSSGRVLTGDAALQAHVRQNARNSNPRTVRAMAEAIGPAYNRLR